MEVKFHQTKPLGFLKMVFIVGGLIVRVVVKWGSNVYWIGLNQIQPHIQQLSS